MTATGTYRPAQGFVRIPRLQLRSRFALAFLLLCLVQLATSLHALAPHAVCLEHGESIHQDVSGAVAGAPSPDPGVRAGAEAGLDEHCPLLVFRASGCAALSSPLRSGTVARAQVPRLLDETGSVPEPVSRLDLAPKASPPRC
jgi:hypothetical protein